MLDEWWKSCVRTCTGFDIKIYLVRGTHGWTKEELEFVEDHYITLLDEQQGEGYDTET